MYFCTASAFACVRVPSATILSRTVFRPPAMEICVLSGRFALLSSIMAFCLSLMAVASFAVMTPSFTIWSRRFTLFWPFWACSCSLVIFFMSAVFCSMYFCTASAFACVRVPSATILSRTDFRPPAICIFAKPNCAPFLEKSAVPVVVLFASVLFAAVSSA